jgi:hypothetical protein
MTGGTVNNDQEGMWKEEGGNNLIYGTALSFTRIKLGKP